MKEFHVYWFFVISECLKLNNFHSFVCGVFRFFYHFLVTVFSFMINCSFGDYNRFYIILMHGLRIFNHFLKGNLFMLFFSFHDLTQKLKQRTCKDKQNPYNLQKTRRMPKIYHTDPNRNDFSCRYHKRHNMLLKLLYHFVNKYVTDKG